MIGVETWPKLGSQDSSGTESVFQNAPRSLRDIFRSVIEEVIIVNTFFSSIQIDVFLDQGVSEMEVILDGESLISLETFEGLVLPHFVQWDLFNSSSWNDLTV